MLLRNARLADGRSVDVRVCLDTVDAVEPSLPAAPGEEVVDLGGRLLLPAPAEPHAHLDKAFLAERFENPTGDLIGAVTAMEANRHLITVPDIAERAERAVRLMVANGVTAIRTHADTTLDNGLRSVEALIGVRDRLRDLCDIQVVALTGWTIKGGQASETLGLLRDAVAMGVDVIGGCPHLDESIEAATDHLMEIAAAAGLPMDLHTDETLDPHAMGLEYLARRVIATGFEPLVTASHCVSLGMQPEAVQRRVAEVVAEARVSVVALPHTNLYLQARNWPVAPPRGLTALHVLRAASVNLCAGADNLQDPFNLVGKGDPLETAALMVMAGHLLPADAYEICSTTVRSALGLPAVAIAAGSPAELMAVPAGSVREAVAFQPAGRITIHKGRIVHNGVHNVVHSGA